LSEHSEAVDWPVETNKSFSFPLLLVDILGIWFNNTEKCSKVGEQIARYKVLRVSRGLVGYKAGLEITFPAKFPIMVIDSHDFPSFFRFETLLFRHDHKQFLQ
jgi:hypothetical protein